MAIKLTKEEKALIADEKAASAEKALEVKDLVISFKTDNGKVQAVRGVSFDLHKGETLCIVGESGSGKSVTSRAIMGILAANAIVEGGHIFYQGEDLLKVSEEEFHRIRGHKIGMIFQDPLSSLNPIVKIGKQITETMLLNADQLKNYYNDLISDELVAYKNAKVVCNTDISIATVKYNNIVAECEAKEKDFKENVIKALDKSDSAAKAEKKAELAALKEENKKVIAEAKKELEEATVAAKAKYKEIAPGLKAALEAKKAVAKEQTKQHADELKAKLDADLAAIKAEKENLVIDAEKQALIDDLEKQIKLVNAKYKAEFYACFFFNKKKQQIRAQWAEELKPLREKLAELTKEKDALDAKEKATIDEYQSQIKVTKKMAKEKALKIMAEVGIPQPEKRFYQYPFQFSGGMRQRIVIAIALICEPDILICDEPTTALDVTIQAQILELINRLKAAHNMSVIFITHDLGVVANMADRVAVMYAGKIAEYGTDKEIFFDPRHPYTWALLSSIPDIDSKEKLEAIPGTPPDMIYPPVGDAFAARNKYALAIDFKYQPPYFQISPTHFVASWLEYEGAPEIDPPKIVTQRIKNALTDEEEKRHE